MCHKNPSNQPNGKSLGVVVIKLLSQAIIEGCSALIGCSPLVVLSQIKLRLGHLTIDKLSSQTIPIVVSQILTGCRNVWYTSINLHEG